MLTNTFIHIQGIGLKTEYGLWQSGIHSWQDFFGARPADIPLGRASYIAESLERSLSNADDPHYFANLLPSSQLWRLFPDFRDRIAYLDIETTGLGEYCDITTIALYNGTDISCYVQGENLDEFPSDLDKYDVIVSYNGKSFDVPVIERYFDLSIEKAHLDLRYILNNLGFKGGLKGCERQLGVDRNGLADANGYTAVLLWDIYRQSRERRVLDTLLTYNIMDAINLEVLLVEAYNRNLAHTPFRDELFMEMPSKPAIPFTADPVLLAKLNRSIY